MGGVDSCRVVPDLVLRGVVASGAPSITTLHNHPNGNPNPSPEDRPRWGTLRDVSKMLGILVLDNNCSIIGLSLILVNVRVNV